MADTSQGEGWWLASDHKWYPPELHADPAHRARHTKAPAVRVVVPGAPPPPEPDAKAAPASARIATEMREAARRSTTDLFDERPSMEELALEPTKRRSRGWLGLIAAGVIVLGGLGVLIYQSRDDDSTPASVTEALARSGLDDGDATAATALPGSASLPAAFGEVAAWPEWQAGIIETFDAVEAEALSEFADPPPEGTTFLAVVYEVIYDGPEISSYDPVVIGVQGSELYEPFACFLDPNALVARGIDVGTYELVAGQRVRLADCFAVPTDEVDDLTFTLDNYQVYDADEVVYAPVGAELPEPEPPTATPDYEGLDLLEPGTDSTWGPWTASVTGVLDAEAEELLSRFVVSPREGFRYLIITYDVAYAGEGEAATIEVYPTALGDAVYTTGNCITNTDALAELSLGVAFELDAGAEASLAQCVEVPVDAEELVVRLENFADFSNEPVYYLVAT